MKKILLTILWMLAILMPSATWAQTSAAEAYAALTEDVTGNMTLTFYYDEQRVDRNGFEIGPFTSTSDRGWHAVREAITEVVFDASLLNYDGITSMNMWFYGLTNLTSVTGVSNLNTPNLTSTRSMFNGCSSLTNLDLNSFNTSAVTEMNFMFEGCSSLTELQVGFSTENVNNMADMFLGCSSLTTLDLSTFNTAKVTSSMDYMFSSCSALTTIYVSSLWNTSSVTSGNEMFNNCQSLVGGAGTTFSTSNRGLAYAHIDEGTSNPGYLTDIADYGKVDEPYAVLSNENTVLTFYYDKKKESRSGLDVTPFSSAGLRPWDSGRSTITTVVFDASFANDTTLTSTANWFFGCTSLISITGIENLKTDNVTSMLGMFQNCESLTSLDLSGFNTSNVESMVNMFYSCKNLTSIDMSHFNTANVTSMASMFYGCQNLLSIDLSGFNTSNVTNMSEMFENCSALTTLDVTGFNTENVTRMDAMFSGCAGLTALDISSFNTAQVTEMTRMFSYCTNLKTIYASSSWSATQASGNSSGMFVDCTNLVGGAGTVYNPSYIDWTYAHIDGGTDNPGYLTDIADYGKVDEPYAVLSDENTVLTFYYDKRKEQNNGMDVGPFTDHATRGWYENIANITRVVFDSSFANDTTLTSTALWFSGCSNLTTITGIENLNTQNVTSMEGMFNACSGLTSLDLSSFNTQNVTYMYNMFFSCSNLTTIYVGSDWSTAKVEEGSMMFEGCTSLVGGASTAYDANHTDHTYAHIDEGTSNPGYFTDINAPAGSTEASVIWAFDTSATEDAIMKPAIAFSGSSVVVNGGTEVETAVPSAGDNSGYTFVCFQPLESSEMNVSWTVNVSSGYTFIPQKLSMRMARFGTDVGTVDLSLTNSDGMSMGLATSLRPARNNQSREQDKYGSDDGYTSLFVADIPEDFSTSGSITLTATISGLSTTKQIGFSDIRFNGTIPTTIVEKACSAPTFSLDGTILTIQTSTPDAQIYYTTDGTTPTTASNLYTQPVVLVQNDVVKAIAVREGWTDSRVSTYTMNLFRTEKPLITISNNMVSMSTSTPDAVIYYTQDGTVPTLESVKYVAPFELPDNCILKAIAKREGYNTSFVATYNNLERIAGRWNFSLGLSETTKLNLKEDTSGRWSYDSITDKYAYQTTLYNEQLAATVDDNEWVIPEAEGLFFTNEFQEAGRVVFVESSGDGSYLLMNGSYGSITIPEIAAGDSVTITYCTHNSDESRGFEINTEGFELADGNTSVSSLEMNTVTVYNRNSYQAGLTIAAHGIEIYCIDKIGSPSEPYAVLSDNNTKLTFYYDGKKAERNGMDIGPFSSESERPWHEMSELIENVIFDSAITNDTTITSTAYWFKDFTNLNTIDGIQWLNTKFVMNMRQMFQNCSTLTGIILDSFNTTNVTTMHGMFYGCSSLQTLKLGSFNTDKVTDTSYMFEGCSSLTELDLNSFTEVKNPYRMFNRCSSLVNLNLSNFQTGDATGMRDMFEGCTNLETLDLSGFQTNQVTDMYAMFQNCSSLKTIYVGSGWTTEKVTDSGNMFYGCTSLVGGMGTTYDANHVDYIYAHIDGGPDNPGYFTEIKSVKRWDFTKWSSETIANLKADAAASIFTGWSDVEKDPSKEGNPQEPTEDTKDNCFWLQAETTDANGVAIAELEGLVFDTNYCSRRSLAIAVNYPSTSLGDYAGGAYLWLGGNNNDCFTIPNVKNGQTITIEAESHKPSEARGITLIAGSTELESFTPTTKASYSWTITEDCDVMVRNINGCHIYTITVYGEGASTDELEIYAVETGSTITPNQAITATQSVIMTPGDDIEWPTNMSMGNAWVNPLNFSASIYYPNSTMTYTFEGSMRGTNNPKDSVLVDGVSTGSGYKSLNKNLPRSGGFVTFEALKEGSLIVPIRVFAGKPLYVTDQNGKAKTDIQFKDANGQTLTLQTDPLCAVSADEDVTGFVSFNVQPGEKYFVFSVGSKARFGGYVFSNQSIEIDSASMANVKGILENEAYAALSEDSLTVTFYYDNQKSARGGVDINNNLLDYGVASPYGTATTAVIDVSFANYKPTSTAYWFQNCSLLESVSGMENLKTDSVTDMSYMFYSCDSLRSVDVSGFKTDNVMDMSSMFSACSKLTSLDLSSFNTANVTNMSEMFDNCPNLTTIYVGEGWSTAKVDEGNEMFMECTSLVGGMGTTYDANHVDYIYAHIDGGPDNPGYFTPRNGYGQTATPTFAHDGNLVFVNSTTEGATIRYTIDGEAPTDSTGIVYNDSIVVIRNCTIRAIASKENFTPSEVAEYNVDWFKCAQPTIAWSGDRMTATTATEAAIIQYSLTQSNVETPLDQGGEASPLVITVVQDAVINLYAVKTGWENSDTLVIDYPYTAWQELLSAVELAHQTIEAANQSDKVVKVGDCPYAELNAILTDAEEWYAARTAGAADILDLRDQILRLIAEVEAELKAVVYTYDAENGVLTVGGSTTLAEALEAAGGSSVAATLTSIVWENTTPLTDSDLQGLDNPNMLIYVADASLAPKNRDNIIVGNDSTGYVAMNVMLTDVAEGNGGFYCPKAFTADMISYTHEYRQQTEVGVARGWETIAMPFTVQTIMHETNGLIASFGNEASGKHFWLRQLTQQGLAQARQIEANTPYLISMPNSDVYPAGFNQAGRVTFSSQNVVVPVTQLNVMEAPTANGGMVMIQPNFKTQSATSMIYALNVSMERDGHPEGSVFVANYRAVRPFEAFTVHHGNGPAPQFISIADMNNGGTTGIESLTPALPEGEGSGYYSLDGRKLQKKPTQNGVYLHNGRKVVIR